MENDVDAGPGRVKDGFTPARVGDGLDAEPVTLLHHRAQLRLVETGHELAGAVALEPVDGELDDVHAVLDLGANLFDGFVEAPHQHADGTLGHADPGRVPVAQPLPSRHLPSRAGNPGTLKHPGMDGVAHRGRNPVGGRRIGKRRVSGIEDLSGGVHGPQCPELRWRVHVHVFVGLGIAVAQVDVDIDQAGQYPLPGVVHDRVAGTGPRRLCRGSDIGGHTVLDDDGLIGLQIVTQAVKQISASEERAHGITLSG